ncbi:tetratricopeptide repeat protein [Urechidicola croceus]|uniref:Cell surface protein n=1 Tax=Urechidicola croceus TaxID=1850246 RepID=A0A1D8P5K0_9FLAO|nr:hypothetical protein [Urechidicola croceus]AOW19823.1 cell surface protein [Urechidicola croceus]
MSIKTKICSYLSILIMIVSCNTSTKSITNSEDYNKYLVNTTNKNYQLASSEFEFWTKKFKENPTQFPYLSKIASANSQLFNSTGKIEYLKEAENNLKLVNTRTGYKNSRSLRSLARNYISQHKFKAALDLLKKAEINGENLKDTHKMLFDTYLELGEYDNAFNYLSRIKNTNDFDYLIRLAKWSDHEGKLESAILYMEKAAKIAERSKNNYLMQWSYTNLADFYGHAGRIEDSYNYYLKTLNLNPNDAYAKKGIAWIVFSKERNPQEATRILNAITQKYNTPDYYLLKSEIAEYLGNSLEKEENLNFYFKLIEDTRYGDMYNAYNVLLFSKNPLKINRALEISQREIKNRPTPLSYDLLAWSYLNNGENKKALEVATKNVVGETSEPIVLYHIAEIYKANGLTEKAKNLKVELLESIYELGPLMENKIKNI